jgi:hypothetical protein
MGFCKPWTGVRSIVTWECEVRSPCPTIPTALIDCLGGWQELRGAPISKAKTQKETDAKLTRNTMYMCLFIHRWVVELTCHDDSNNPCNFSFGGLLLHDLTDGLERIERGPICDSSLYLGGDWWLLAHTCNFRTLLGWATLAKCSFVVPFSLSLRLVESIKLSYNTISVNLTCVWSRPGPTCSLLPCVRSTTRRI